MKEQDIELTIDDAIEILSTKLQLGYPYCKPAVFNKALLMAVEALMKQKKGEQL